MPRTPKFQVSNTPRGWLLHVPASISDTGKLQRRYFKTRDAALAEASTLRNDYKANGEKATVLPPRIADQALAAVKLLQGTGGGLIDAARAFRKTWEAKKSSQPFGKAVETYLGAREDLRKSTLDIRVPVDKISPESRKAAGIGQPATAAQYEARIAQLEARNRELESANAKLQQAIGANTPSASTTANAWQQGKNRAACILNIRNVQNSVRSYSNMNNLNPGDRVAGWKSKIIGPGLYMEQFPTCPGGGTYTYANDKVIPAIGTLAITCSLGGPDHHAPADYSAW